MHLCIDTDSMYVTASNEQGGMERISFDRYYPLWDSDGYRFVVRALKKLGTIHTLIVEIKYGKQLIQRSNVRIMSATAGQQIDGTPKSLPYIVNLHPEEPIWPIEQLVEQLMAIGIQALQITPMPEGFESELSDCVSALFSPKMLCDGQISVRSLPAEGDLVARRLFEVKDASWAVRYSGSEKQVLHIYLWRKASDAADDILSTVRRIRGKALATSA